MAAEIKDKELNAESQRLRDARSRSSLKGITEQGNDCFHRDGFTLAVDLAIAEAITTSLGQHHVQSLALLVAALF
eukprot:968321-Pleurochrysis_carterae.AAC.7